MKQIINALEKLDISLVIVICIFVALVIVINYILLGFGLYKLSKKTNKDNNWMAWFPYLNKYYLGNVAISSSYGIIVIAMSSFAAIFEKQLSIFIIFNSVYYILNIISYVCIINKLKCKRKRYIYGTIFTLGLLGPLFMFMLRNKKID